MTRASPRLPDNHRHLDGYALLFGGAMVDVFPTLDGAVSGRAVARLTLAFSIFTAALVALLTLPGSTL